MNSSELKGYLTGLIFGDAYIDKGVTKRAFVLKTINRDFALKVKEDIESCSPFQVFIKHNLPIIKDGVNHKEYWEVKIYAHPYFAKKYHHFYDDYKNRIASKEALNWITPQGLSNWYMCDGYVCLVGKESGLIKNRRIDFCTDRYSLSTIESMQKMLKNKFNIESSIIKRGRFYRIRIKATSYETFIDLVKPYIIPSMLYKLYLGYPTKPKVLTEEGWRFQKYLQSAIALTSKVEG